MSDNKLSAELKTRVPEEMKSQLAEIAGERHLDTSDIVREALRQYLAKAPELQEESA